MVLSLTTIVPSAISSSEPVPAGFLISMPYLLLISIVLLAIILAFPPLVIPKTPIPLSPLDGAAITVLFEIFTPEEVPSFRSIPQHEVKIT